MAATLFAKHLYEGISEKLLQGQVWVWVWHLQGVWYVLCYQGSCTLVKTQTKSIARKVL